MECLPGVRVDAVFVFCDIRQFTDVTECLQGGVMVFVNHIARIVHGVRAAPAAGAGVRGVRTALTARSAAQAAACFGGAANKNIGDAFLLVWKLPADRPKDALAAAGGSIVPLVTSTSRPDSDSDGDDGGGKRSGSAEVDRVGKLRKMGGRKGKKGRHAHAAPVGARGRTHRDGAGCAAAAFLFGTRWCGKRAIEIYSCWAGAPKDCRRRHMAPAGSRAP